jgi:hypothetical protein
MNQDQPVELPIKDEEGTGFYPLDWLLTQLKSLLLTLWDMFTDLLIFVVDTVMTAGLVILEGFSSVFELIDLSSYITSMPPEVQHVMAATGFGQAVGIVMTAGAARLLMQLIPFVRLGS